MSIDPERIRRRLEELVATPSVTGEEGAAVELTAGWLGSAGADEVDQWVDPMSELEGDPAYPGREREREDVPVVAARLVGRRPGPTLVITGHLDTVPVGEGGSWSGDPFTPLVGGDRLTGLGACDMKGGMIAALEVFEAFAAGDRDFAGELRLVAVSGEEDGGTGTLSAIRRGWAGDQVIITEPTWRGGRPQVVVAHGGALTFTIDVEGRSAHGSTPQEGASAVEHFITVYQALKDLETELCEQEENPLMRRLGIPYATTVGIVRGGTWASNVMDRLTAEVRAGVALGESIEAAENRFVDQLLSAVAADPWLAAHPPVIRRTGAAFGSSSIDTADPLVTTLVEAGTGVLDQRPTLVGAPYGCDMALWINEGQAATVVFGPGDVAHAHSADEWVSLGEIESVARVLHEAGRRLLTESGTEARA